MPNHHTKVKIKVTGDIVEIADTILFERHDLSRQWLINTLTTATREAEQRGREREVDEIVNLLAKEEAWYAVEVIQKHYSLPPFTTTDVSED